MIGVYKQNTPFYREIVKTVLLHKHDNAPILEEVLERLAGMPSVREEIDRTSKEILNISNNLSKDSKDKELATMEVMKPAREMASENDKSVPDSSLASSPDSPLSEEGINDPALSLEQKGNEKPPTVNLAKETVKPAAKPQARFRLVNATVGRDYTDELGIDCPADISVTNITGLSATGLQYDPEKAIVKGAPAKPGEFKLSAQYRLTADPDGGSWSQDFTFIVNPDPKGLWRDIASDRSVPFWKADNESQGKVGQKPWMLAAASRRGRSHAHVGGCRDDDFRLTSSNASGWHVLAVSDGAGSANLSREGARLAAQRASEVLADRLDELDARLEEAVAKWQQGREDEMADKHEKVLKQSLYEAFRLAVYEPVKEIDKLAREKDQNYRDFYATVLLCAHKTIGNEQFVAGYWIGDGAMAVYAEGEYIKLLGESDGGEYAGQTRFLDGDAVSSQEKIMQRIRFDSRPEISAICLMTDGVSDPKFETDANLQNQEKWDGFWKEIKPQLDQDPERTSENLLDWLGFWSAGNHDDRTLALLYPKSVVTGTTDANTAAKDTPKEETPDTEATGDE
uniref:Protein phosphatase 2C n=1 Tax=Candidatus Kentrum sp. FM TaxID=2126340 RepID=A0A450VTQ4_9GAMM|nr:MAG: Protein phosphatase 2C [Candidatus Kentron sp. FM]VFJ48679.1 MAG: Protein phosphatase 2C [Candidatus Kentron sp. FM]VFK08170.1 MAG: Protein phosphatase 2C [Candidatus Kentron sp. FM]